MNTFTYFFLLALAGSLGVRFWLAARQLSHVRKHRDTVPASFAGRIPLKDHHKAADYTLTNTRIGMIALLYDSLLLLGWTLGGGLEWLDNSWRGAALHPVVTGTAVMFSALVIMTLLDLPFSLYHTFVVEERFGFNRSTPTVFFTDLLKNALLLVVIGGPLIALALWIMEASGGLWWLYLWAVWMVFTLVMYWAYPAVIAPLFNKFSPLDNDALKQRIQALLDKCGFRSKGIFVMDGSKRSGHGNAYFTGFGNNKRIVFFDTLLESLNPTEIEAVLAHELGHFKLRHIQKRLLMTFALSLVALALLGWLAAQDWFYQGLGISQPSPWMALLLFMLAMPVFTFFLQPLMSLLSRKHEFEADAYAVRQANGADLIKALVKMYRENASTLTPDPLYSAFHDSHPPAPVRISHISATMSAH
ncbi:MAG: M48 family metallopeptidase [Gammaproteobacteria bacterium]|jgi:STE24 endopeptidase|nr:M48 family metallopeptidase [Gammaproteobacteria bacterium]